MTGPFLGGFAYGDTEWISATTLAVSFSDNWPGMLMQLYMGRTLIGVTDDPSSTVVAGEAIPSEWPEEFQLLAVDPADKLTDFGSQLPPRPYNRLKVAYDTTAWAADAKYAEITAGDGPGAAVDTSNVLANEIVDFLGPHEFITDPLPGSGTWHLEIAGRDQTAPNGNRGTALAVAGTIDAHPPDWLPDANGNRFTTSVAGDQLTVTFTYA
jgi:hypothetical protein